MPPKQFTAFRLEPSQLEALRAIRDRDGVPVSEQVRRAIDAWIATKGSRRGVSRKATGKGHRK
jgi:hypothetical protein